ncbi:TPA: hypothetical protein DIV55_05160 [Patescibacteria group bacterium]|nr:hypothetical protein [Patescibacteria group bacterium]
MRTRLMNICFFGSYQKTYSRNKILLDGLLKNNVKVIHCNSHYGFFFQRYWELADFFWRNKQAIDVIYVAFPGQLDMPLGWALGKLFRKPVVLDMYYSMYDTFVFDRKTFTPKSFRGRAYYYIDKLAATLADHIITDTHSHASHFSKLFKIPKEKFTRIFVGGDDAVFRPNTRKHDRKNLIVEFHGMFSRAQGAEYFIEAAKLLEWERNLKFLLIGDSTHYLLPKEKLAELQPKNLTYLGEVSLSRLAQLVAAADICVGHFGSIVKAKNAISNKTFHAIFSAKPIIVMDSQANRELFVNGVSALFVRPGDARDLAQKIRLLSKSQKLRRKLVDNASKLLPMLTNEYLASQLIQVFFSLK